MTKWLTNLISGASSGLLARVAIWAGVAVLTVAGSLAVALWIQTARLSDAQSDLGRTETLMEVCRDTNEINARALAEIERQAQRDLAAAERNRQAAERAAERASASHAEYRTRVARLREQVREASGGAECSDVLVPAAVDRLFRDGAADRVPDRDQDGDRVRGDPGQPDRAPGPAGDPG